MGYLCANLVFLGLSVLELRPMYATDVRQKHHLMPPPYGGGGIIIIVFVAASVFVYTLNSLRAMIGEQCVTLEVGGARHRGRQAHENVETWLLTRM